MSSVEEREEVMRMLLAEVAPGERFVVHIGDKPGGVRFGRTNVRASVRARAAWKAARLSLLHLEGPDAVTGCDRCIRDHLWCDGLPVSWALLGHVCGRTS